MKKLKDNGKTTETKTVSLRIKGRLITSLERDAKSREISFNTLANQIFTEYIEWYSSAPKSGYVTVRRSLINAILESFSLEEMTAFARRTEKDTREMSLQIAGEYTLPSLLRIIEHKSHLSGYKVRKDVSDGFVNYIITHDMGKKWSVYLGELFKTEIEGVSQPVEIEVLDNTVRFRVSEQ